MASEAAHEGHSRLDSPSPLSHEYAEATGAGGHTHEAGSQEPDNVSSVDDHVEDKVPPERKLNKKEKFKRHCAKWWWVHLIITIVLLAILLPILFTLVIPAIVQDIVNSQTLPVKAGALDFLTSDDINVTLTTTLNTPLPAKIGKLTLELYNKPTPGFFPFINLVFPEHSVDHKTNITMPTTYTAVRNETELVKWFNEYFEEEEVKLSVKATPHINVHLGVLHSTPHFDKTIKVPGLNYLKGFGASDLKLSLPPQKNGTNIQGKLMLPNSGVLTLALGNLTLNMMSGKLNVGVVYVNDVTLLPGNNTFDFAGTLYLDTLITNIGTVIKDQETYLEQGNIALNTTGNATIVNGEHVSYLEQVLKTKVLTIQLPVIELIGDFAQALLGGGHASLTDILNDVFDNSTFIDKVISNFNQTTQQNGHSSTGSGSSKKKRLDPAASLAWNMLRLGARRSK